MVWLRGNGGEWHWISGIVANQSLQCRQKWRRLPVPEELIRTQELRDKQALKEKILLEFQKKYIRGVYDKVASGVITLPENVEESAVEYAKAEYLKLFPPVIEEAPAAVMVTFKVLSLLLTSLVI